MLSPEVVELVGSRCLLEPMGGGNARLLDLLDPYHLPPEVWRACAAMCSHLQAGRQCQCQLAGWLAGSAQPVPLGLAGLLPILEGSVRGTLYLGLDPACLTGCRCRRRRRVPPLWSEQPSRWRGSEAPWRHCLRRRRATRCRWVVVGLARKFSSGNCG